VLRAVCWVPTEGQMVSPMEGTTQRLKTMWHKMKSISVTLTQHKGPKKCKWSQRLYYLLCISCPLSQDASLSEPITLEVSPMALHESNLCSISMLSKQDVIIKAQGQWEVNWVF
jgi:hypothetical protein